MTGFSRVGGAAGIIVTMSMRKDCSHYVSRTYSSGEVMQSCDLDVAPDAPWRCPDDCVLYEKRSLSRVGWEMGSLKDVATQSEPTVIDSAAEAALAEAEAIVNEVTPGVAADWERQQQSGKRKKRRRKDR